MNIEEVRSKTDAELDFEMDRMQKELFETRFRADADTSKNPAAQRQLRRSIARVKTVLHERKSGIRGQEAL